MRNRLAPLLGLCVGLTLALTTPAFAAPGRTDARIETVLADPGRWEKDRAQDGDRHAAEVLAFMQLRPGQRVADLFAGAGYFSELLARMVTPGGIVIAYNNAPYQEGSDRIRRDRMAGDRLPNLALMISDANGFSLAPASVDRALFSLSYHDLYWESAKDNWPRVDAARFLQRLARAMKPGGRVVVIDHVGEPADPVESVRTLHRIDPAVIRRDFEAAGFVFDAESTALRNPADDHRKPMWDETVRGRTDRILWRFRKP